MAISIGWIRAGKAPQDYEFSTEPSDRRTGKTAARLRSTVDPPSAFGTLMQEFLADDYRSQRVRLSGWLKSDAVEAHGAIWLRVDAGDRMSVLDNMQTRPIRGTTDWRKYDVVLDVAADATRIAFGLLLDGKGTLWLDEPTFEIVGPDVAITVPGLPRSPQNLDFET